MHKPLLALAAALLASAAAADTLIENANGIQVDGAGHLQHFTGLLVGDGGKVVRVLRAGDYSQRPPPPSMRTAALCCPD